MAARRMATESPPTPLPMTMARMGRSLPGHSPAELGLAHTGIAPEEKVGL